MGEMVSLVPYHGKNIKTGAEVVGLHGASADLVNA